MEEALQISQLVTNIIIILLFILIVILIFKVIHTMRIVSEKVEKASVDFKDLKPKVETTVEKINSLSDNVNSLVTKINSNVDVVETVVNNVKGTVDDILEFERKIQQKIEPPVMDTLNTVNAISVGVRTFFDRLKSSKRQSLIDKELEEINIVEDSMEDANKELDEINAKLSDLQK